MEVAEVVELEVLEEIKHEVADLAAQGIAETADRGSEYPHYYKLSSTPSGCAMDLQAADGPGHDAHHGSERPGPRRQPVHRGARPRTREGGGLLRGGGGASFG